MQKIHLKLTLEEVNLILKALGQQPFVEVYELIGSINAQANQQLKNGTLSIDDAQRSPNQNDDE